MTDDAAVSASNVLESNNPTSDTCNRPPPCCKALSQLSNVRVPDGRGVVASGLRAQRPRRQAWLWWSTAAAFAVVAVSALWWGHELFDSIAAPDELRIETRVNEHREVELADGSKVTVGAKSQLTVRIGDRTRKLWLAGGQAYFEVARDERPFVVQVHGGTITATGTEFDVRQIGLQVEVSVVEGSVEVASLPAMRQPQTDTGEETNTDVSVLPKFPPTAVKQGERLAFGEVFVPIEPLDAESVRAWRSGYLHYAGQPLSEVIADVQRYTTQRLILADEAVGKLRFRGTIYRDNVRDWLERLEQSLPVDVDFQDRRTVVLQSRQAPEPP